MTLTHLIPSLRRSLPNPIHRDYWPEFTSTTPTDVSVAGVSLTRLAEWCGAPCVHTAAAVVPGSGGVPSPTELMSVIVARVLAVEVIGDGSADVWVDARLSECAVLEEVRMIGRVSTARDVPVRVRSPYDGTQGDPVYLAGDLRPGDLLAVPCRGVALLRDVDPRRHHLVREDESDGGLAPARCGR